MRFTFLLLVYSHIVIFANPSYSKNHEVLKINIEHVKGEIRKFSFHEAPVLIENLPALTNENTRIDLIEQGYNLIIINFWATWCKPCIEEMSSLDKLQALFKNEKLKIITIATGRNNPKKIANFFKENKISNLDNFRDPKGSLALNLGVLGLPTSIIISPNGYEIARLIGPINWIQFDVIKFFKNLAM